MTGADLSPVRVHEGGASGESARQAGALAYSLGADVVIGTRAGVRGEASRTWLVAHELTHAAQHLAGRGRSVLHRQPDKVAELDRNYADALAKSDWKQVALVLNDFNDEDIDKRLNNRNPTAGPVLSRGQIAAIYAGALEEVGKDAAIANHTRAVYLDLNYENEMSRGDFAKAAEFLNGFNEGDILARVRRIGEDLGRLEALHAGAVTSVGPTSPVAIHTAKRIASVRLQQRVAALQESGELSLPTSTAPGGSPGQPMYIAVGRGAGGGPTGVAVEDREPLAPDKDWSVDPGYIDNDVDHTTYNILTNYFLVVYTNGSEIALDYGSVRAASTPLPQPAAPSPIAAPAAGVQAPPPLPPTTPPHHQSPQTPTPAEPRAAPNPLGARGLYFRAKSSGRVYPTVLNKATVPTIYACAEETARREPAARERTRDALINVASAAKGTASAAIASAQKAALFSLGARRRSGAQFLLRNVDPAEVEASKQGYQVYEYWTADGRCLYVGKAGGAGGSAPDTWIDRGWAHIAEKPAIAEADTIKVTSGLTEQEAFALEETRIGDVRSTAGNLNLSPGEYSTRFPGGGLSDNAASAVRNGKTFTFETDISASSPKPVPR
jgi:hypothetical protein